MIADWYFDFVSPFSYLQCERLQSHAASIRPHPVVFAAILDANGQKGPAEIVAKRVFTYRFVVWQAKALGIPFKFPHAHPFNPIPLLRLAIACDCRLDAITRIFRFVWRDGRLPDLPIEWAELAHELGLPDADARINDPAVKDALRRKPMRPSREACSACRRSRRATSFSGARTRRTWRSRTCVPAGAMTIPNIARVAALPAAAVRGAAKPSRRA